MSGRVADAVVEFKFALWKDPYTLEAVEQLAKLGCDECTMLALIDVGLKRLVTYKNDECTAHVNMSVNSNEEVLTAEIKPLIPLRKYAQAHSTLNRNQLPASLGLFNGLSSKFPHHPHLILHKAHIQQELGQILASEQNYQRVRTLDMHWVAGLDKYAHLLFQLRMSRKNAFMLKQGGYMHYLYSCHGGREKMENDSMSCGVEDELGQLSADLLDIDSNKQYLSINSTNMLIICVDQFS